MIKYELKKAGARSAAILIALLCAVSLLSGLLGEHEEKPKGYGETYSRTLDDIIYNASVNYRRIADKKSAPARFQEEIVRRYGALVENDVSGEVRGWDVLLSAVLPFVFAFVSSAAVAFTVSSADVRGDLLLLSFRERRGSIAVSKLLAVCAAAVVFNILAAGFAFLGALISSGFAGGGLPIATIPAYMRCPYNITASGGFALRLAVSTLSSIALGVLVMLAVTVLKRRVYIALAAVAATVLDLTLRAVSTDVLHFFYNFTFSGSVTDSFLTRFSGVGIGGGIFLSRLAVLFAVPLIFAAVLSALFVLSVALYSGVSPSGKRRAGHGGEGRRGHSLVYYEFRRVCNARAIIAVAVLFSLDAALSALGVGGGSSAWERAYRQAVLSMDGMRYEEQVAATEREVVGAREDAAKLEGARELFEAGEISGEEYSELVRSASSAEFKLSVYESISEKLDFIGRYRPDVDGVLVYDLGWRALLSRRIDILPALAALFVSVPYIFSERATGYDRILTALLSKSERRKFTRRKAAVSAAVSALVLILFFALELAFISSRFGFASWTKPAVGAGIAPPLGALPSAVVLILRYAAYAAVVFVLEYAAAHVARAKK